jgi:hypothetical protein
LDNSKLNAAPLLAAIGGLLKERYAIKGTMVRTKGHGFSYPVEEPIAQEMAQQCDVVIAAIGDWGSCSAASVADGTVFEKRGIPAAAIITHTFTASANAMARRNGFPEYRYAMIPNPLSSLNEEQVRQRAREVLPEVLAILGIEEKARTLSAAAS